MRSIIRIFVMVFVAAAAAAAAGGPLLTAGITEPGEPFIPTGGLLPEETLAFPAGLRFPLGEADLDPGRGVGYGLFGDTVTEYSLLKFRLSGEEPMAVVGSVSVHGLRYDQDARPQLALDLGRNRGYVLFPSDSPMEPSLLATLDLGDAQEAPTVVGSTPFEIADDTSEGFGAEMCHHGDHLFLAYASYLTKIDVSGATPVEAIRAPFPDPGMSPTGLAIKPSGEVGAFTFRTETGLDKWTTSLLKFTPGTGALAPQFGPSTVLPGSIPISYGIATTVDWQGNRYYMVDNDYPSKVVRVALGEDLVAPTMLDSTPMFLPPAEYGFTPPGFWTISIDGKIYYIWNDYITQVSVENEAAPPKFTGFLRLSDLTIPGPLLLDTTTNTLYNFGAMGMTRFSQNNGMRGLLMGSAIRLSSLSRIESMSFYSHAADGNLRLSVYDGTNLLWTSGVLSNNVEEGLVEVPISSGTPSSLTLGPGKYWLAWQTDSASTVGSSHIVPYANPYSTEAFASFAAFDAAPPAMDPYAFPGEDGQRRWTQFITYRAIEPTGWSVK